MDKELKAILQTLATKKDLERFATKSDLQDVKEDILGIKEGIRVMQLDISGFKKGQKGLRQEVSSLKQEIVGVKKVMATTRDLRDMETRLKGYADKQVEKLARMVAESSTAERRYVDQRFAQLEKNPAF